MADSAFIFERTGKIAKTHKGGMNVQFHKLARDAAYIETQLSAPLTSACHCEVILDCEIGARDWRPRLAPEIGAMTEASRDDATSAIATAGSVSGLKLLMDQLTIE